MIVGKQSPLGTVTAWGLDLSVRRVSATEDNRPALGRGCHSIHALNKLSSGPLLNSFHQVVQVDGPVEDRFKAPALQLVPGHDTVTDDDPDGKALCPAR